LHIDLEKTWRGGQQQVFWLAEGLQKKGHRNFALCIKGGALLERLASAGIECFSTGMFFEFDPFAIKNAAVIINRIQPDILHLHSGHAQSIGVLAAKFSGTRPRIVTTRRVDFHLKSKWKYVNADRIIAISEGVRKVLIADGVPAEKIQTVYSGIDLDRFSGSASEDYLYKEFNIASGRPVIVTVAALAPHKDLKTLISAAAVMKKTFPEAVFIIVGEGELEKELKAQAEAEGVSQTVIFTGFRMDVPQFLKIGAVFVLSSYLEGLGTSVIDAMACGLPVVATKVGGIPELIKDGENGFLVEPGNPELLAERIKALLEQPGLRARFSSNNIARASGFSKDQMIQGTEKVYGELV
jgi:glycosyltransferase involved in cell wall biosynthesis